MPMPIEIEAAASHSRRPRPEGRTSVVQSRESNALSFVASVRASSRKDDPIRPLRLQEWFGRGPGTAVDGGGAMIRRKLSPREIVERLQMVEALTAEGLSVAQAIRSAGVVRIDYDRWRIEYNGLLRTLGPLSCASPKLAKRTLNAASGRASRAPK